VAMGKGQGRLLFIRMKSVQQENGAIRNTRSCVGLWATKTDVRRRQAFV
jgi:hypothetical protein